MDILSKLYYVLAGITLISYIVFFEKARNYKKYILLYTISIGLTSIAAWYLAHSPARNNLVVFHVFTILEYTILSLLYYREIRNKKVREAILISIPAFLLLHVLFSVFIQPIKSNNSYAVVLESILIIGYSLFFLRQLLLFQEVPSLLTYPMFWISVGFLFYFTGDLLLEGLQNYYLRNSMSLAVRMYKLSFIFKYVLFLLLTVAILSEKFSDQKKTAV